MTHTNSTEVKILKKIYKGNKLEFRPDGITPGFYIGYKQNGVKFEENTPGWGWTLAAFFESQLEELEDWEAVVIGV